MPALCLTADAVAVRQDDVQDDFHISHRNAIPAMP